MQTLFQSPNLHLWLFESSELGEITQAILVSAKRVSLGGFLDSSGCAIPRIQVHHPLIALWIILRGLKRGEEASLLMG